jgi:hypothetical protein
MPTRTHLEPLLDAQPPHLLHEQEDPVAARRDVVRYLIKLHASKVLVNSPRLRRGEAAAMLNKKGCDPTRSEGRKSACAAGAAAVQKSRQSSCRQSDAGRSMHAEVVCVLQRKASHGRPSGGAVFGGCMALAGGSVTLTASRLSMMQKFSGSAYESLRLGGP